MKRIPGEGGWTFVVIEGYCLFRASRKKYTKVVPVDPKDMKAIGKWKKTRNPCYIKGNKPKYCPYSPSYICLANKCPFFGYSEANVEKEEKRSKNKTNLVINLN
jgi:hypothetical protein